MIPIAREELTMRKWPLHFVVAVYIFLTYILYKKNELTKFGIPLVIGLCILLIVYYFFSKIKIVIDSDGITQELFSGKKKEIKWNKMKESQLHMHFHGHGGSLEWEIIPYSGKTITLQAGFLNRRSIRLIAEAIVTRCPNAVIDKRIRNIAEGKFPWYIF